PSGDGIVRPRQGEAGAAHRRRIVAPTVRPRLRRAVGHARGGSRRRRGPGVVGARARPRRRKSLGVSPVQRWKARVKWAGSEYPSVRATSPIFRPGSLSISRAASKRTSWTTPAYVRPAPCSRRWSVRALVRTEWATRRTSTGPPASNTPTICRTRRSKSRAEASRGGGCPRPIWSRTGAAPVPGEPDGAPLRRPCLAIPCRAEDGVKWQDLGGPGGYRCSAYDAPRDHPGTAIDTEGGGDT